MRAALLLLLLAGLSTIEAQTDCESLCCQTSCAIGSKLMCSACIAHCQADGCPQGDCLEKSVHCAAPPSVSARLAAHLRLLLPCIPAVQLLPVAVRIQPAELDYLYFMLQPLPAAWLLGVGQTSAWMSKGRCGGACTIDVGGGCISTGMKWCLRGNAFRDRLRRRRGVYAPRASSCRKLIHELPDGCCPGVGDRVDTTLLFSRRFGTRGLNRSEPPSLWTVPRRTAACPRIDHSTPGDSVRNLAAKSVARSPFRVCVLPTARPTPSQCNPQRY